MIHDLVYEQSSGRLLLEDIDGGAALLARCYSGAPGFVNDPDAQGEVGRGPIPRGLWLVGRAVRHSTLGPAAIPLLPATATETGQVAAGTTRLGRSGFYIHGDNDKRNQSASRGCIVCPRVIRDVIIGLGIKRLVVVV